MAMGKAAELRTEYGFENSTVLGAGNSCPEELYVAERGCDGPSVVVQVERSCLLLD